MLPDLDVPSSRDEAIGLLSHLAKRIRPNLAAQLPCVELVAFVAGEGVFSRNFAIAFIEMGAPRLHDVRLRGQLVASALGALTLDSVL